MRAISLAAIATLIATVLSAMAFVTALVRYRRDHAVRFAAVFATGYLVAAAFAAVLGATVFDVDAHIPPMPLSLLYLAVLTLSGLCGGGFASWWYAGRSDPSLRRTATGGR